MYLHVPFHVLFAVVKAKRERKEKKSRFHNVLLTCLLQRTQGSQHVDMSHASTRIART
jgi:hypothetical protein